MNGYDDESRRGEYLSEYLNNNIYYTTIVPATTWTMDRDGIIIYNIGIYVYIYIHNI